MVKKSQLYEFFGLLFLIVMVGSVTYVETNPNILQIISSQAASFAHNRCIDNAHCVAGMIASKKSAPGAVYQNPVTGQTYDKVSGTTNTYKDSSGNTYTLQNGQLELQNNQPAQTKATPDDQSYYDVATEGVNAPEFNQVMQECNADPKFANLCGVSTDNYENLQQFSLQKLQGNTSLLSQAQSISNANLTKIVQSQPGYNPNPTLDESKVAQNLGTTLPPPNPTYTNADDCTSHAMAWNSTTRVCSAPTAAQKAQTVSCPVGTNKTTNGAVGYNCITAPPQPSASIVVNPQGNVSILTPDGGGCTFSSNCQSGNCQISGGGGRGGAGKTCQPNPNPPQTASAPVPVADFAYCENTHDAASLAACEGKLNTAYNILNVIPGFSNYVNAYNPANVNYGWQQMGYTSATDCLQKAVGQAKGACNTYNPTNQQIASSVQVGSELTAAVAAIVSTGGAAGGLITTGADITGATLLQTGGSLLTSTLAIQAESSTGNAVSTCIVNGVKTTQCAGAAGLAALSWANIGSVDYITNAVAAGTQQAAQAARLVGTGISAANAGFTGSQAVQNCFGKNFSALGCVVSSTFTAAALYTGINEGVGYYQNLNPAAVGVQSSSSLGSAAPAVSDEVAAVSTANETAQGSGMLFAPEVNPPNLLASIPETGGGITVTDQTVSDLSNTLADAKTSANNLINNITGQIQSTSNDLASLNKLGNSNFDYGFPIPNEESSYIISESDLEIADQGLAQNIAAEPVAEEPVPAAQPAAPVAAPSSGILTSNPADPYEAIAPVEPQKNWLNTLPSQDIRSSNETGLTYGLGNIDMLKQYSSRWDGVWDPATSTLELKPVVDSNIVQEGNNYYDTNIVDVSNGNVKLKPGTGYNLIPVEEGQPQVMLELPQGAIPLTSGSDTLIFRGINNEGMQDALETGLLSAGPTRTNGIFYTIEPDTAIHYAAQSDLTFGGATFDKPSYVVAIRQPAGLSADARGYVVLNDSVPLDQVVKIYEVRPYLTQLGKDIPMTLEQTGGQEFMQIPENFAVADSIPQSQFVYREVSLDDITGSAAVSGAAPTTPAGLISTVEKDVAAAADAVGKTVGDGVANVEETLGLKSPPLPAAPVSTDVLGPAELPTAKTALEVTAQVKIDQSALDVYPGESLADLENTAAVDSIEIHPLSDLPPEINGQEPVNSVIVDETGSKVYVQNPGSTNPNDLQDLEAGIQRAEDQRSSPYLPPAVEGYREGLAQTDTSILPVGEVPLTKTNVVLAADVPLAPDAQAELTATQAKLEAMTPEGRAQYVYNLEKVSTTDPLTGVLNRRTLNADLETEIAVAQRNDRNLTLIFTDLKNFKVGINDALGHAAGDEALQTYAELLTNNLRAGVKIYRYGGDEFVILLTDTSADEAAVVVTRLRSALSDLQNAPDAVQVTKLIDFRAGIQEVNPATDTVASITAAADAKMYEQARGAAASVAAPVEAHLQPNILQQLNNNNILGTITTTGFVGLAAKVLVSGITNTNWGNIVSNITKLWQNLPFNKPAVQNSSSIPSTQTSSGQANLGLPPPAQNTGLQKPVTATIPNQASPNISLPQSSNPQDINSKIVAAAVANMNNCQPGYGNFYNACYGQLFHDQILQPGETINANFGGNPSTDPNSLYWCTSLVKDAAQAAGVTITGDNGADAMYQDFTNKKDVTLTENSDISSPGSSVKPGEVAFVTKESQPGYIGHVGIVSDVQVVDSAHVYVTITQADAGTVQATYQLNGKGQLVDVVNGQNYYIREFGNIQQYGQN